MAEEYKIIRITTEASGGLTGANREDIASSAVTFTVSGLTVSQDFTVGGQFNSSGDSSFGTISASTIYSGSTNLYDIFLTSADGNDITRVQPGTNIATGGTENFPIINLENDIVLTSVNATSISGGTLYSGTTDIGDFILARVLKADFNAHTGDTGNPHFVTASQVGAYTTSETDSRLNTKANLSGATFTGNIDTPSLSATSISGGTIYSGGTDLYNIFLTSADGNDITRVQPGTNITTGGTANEPTVNLVDSPSINGLTASGTSNFTGVIQSGGTDLYNIFLTSADGNDITRVQPGTNTTTGGTANEPTVNLVDSPSFNQLTTSGQTTINSDLTVTGDSLFNTLSATTLSGGTLYGDGSNLTGIGAGASVNLTWRFSTITTESDPGSKNFRFDASEFSAVTKIFVNDTANSGIDAGTLLSIFDNGDRVYLQQNDDGTKAAAYTLSAATIDNTGWWTIPVSYDVDAGGGVPINNKECGFIFFNVSSGGSGDITRVQPGANITTGGTDNFPVINLADNVETLSFSASTISGGTFYGDGSNLTGITATWDGIETITVGNSVVSGDLLYLDNDGAYRKVSNTGETTSSTELRIATATISSGATGTALIQGKLTTSGLVAGDKYWLGTGGAFTNTQPTSDGSIVRYIGTALNTTIIEFMPDETYIEITTGTGGVASQPSFVNVTSSYSILTTDYTINVTASGATTQTLPTAVGVQGIT
jgi:hypothetical protein